MPQRARQQAEVKGLFASAPGFINEDGSREAAE